MRARVYDRDHLDHYDLDLLVDDVALPRAAGRRTAMPRTSTDRWTSGGGSSAGGDDHPRPRERRPARHGQREGILRLRRRCGHRARRRPPPTVKATIKMPTAG